MYCRYCSDALSHRYVSFEQLGYPVCGLWLQLIRSAPGIQQIAKSYSCFFEIIQQINRQLQMKGWSEYKRKLKRKTLSYCSQKSINWSTHLALIWVKSILTISTSRNMNTVVYDRKNMSMRALKSYQNTVVQVITQSLTLYIDNKIPHNHLTYTHLYL